MCLIFVPETSYKTSRVGLSSVTFPVLAVCAGCQYKTRQYKILLGLVFFVMVLKEASSVVSKFIILVLW